MIKKFDLSDIHNLARLENKFWCFMGDGDGGDGSGEAGSGEGSGGVADSGVAGGPGTGPSSEDLGSWDDFLGGPQNFSPNTVDQNYASYDDTPTEQQFDPFGLFAPVEEDIPSSRKLKRILYPQKVSPTYGLVDPVIDLLPKLSRLVDRDTAKELTANLLSMDVEVAKQARAALDKGTGTKEENKQNQGLLDLIQKQLDNPEANLSQYYKNFAPMNELEKAGLKTFGTGYRGEYEARAPNARSREEYDPVTLMASGTGPRSGTLSLFSQFAKENPAMTAMEALSAFNAVGSFGTLNEADLGMLGYSPNQAVGPQAAFTENAREEGFYQGLGMLGRAAVGGVFGVAADMALSGTPNPTMVSSILAGLNDATKGDTGVGIVDEVSSVYDQIADPVSEAFDTAASNFGSFVDSNVNNLADFFSVNNTEAVDAVDEGQPTSQAAQAEQDAQDYAQAISGVPADPSMGLADPAFAVQGQLQPGSFFSGLTPEQVESYVNTVSTPESTRRYVERRNTPYPMQPTTSIESDPFMPVSEQTSSFFPEVDLPNNSRFFELANIYGPERAQQLLGLA